MDAIPDPAPAGPAGVFNPADASPKRENISSFEYGYSSKLFFDLRIVFVPANVLDAVAAFAAAAALPPLFFM